MLIYNDRALIAVGLGILVGFLTNATWHNAPLAFTIGIVLSMGIDVWMRFHSEDCDQALIHPDAGAHLFFLPVWLVGIIVGIIVTLIYFRVI